MCFRFSSVRSIIRATSVLDAKKNTLQVVHLVVTCYAKSSKDFLRNSDFAAQLSAFLIEIFEVVLHPRSGVMCAYG